jgi:hypothetical protein
MASYAYAYTDNDHVFTITVNGEQKTYTFPVNNLVTVPQAPIHVFSVDELSAMGVPEKIIVEERHKRIAAELSGGTHMSYCFYYINIQPYDGPATRIWIESNAEAEKLRDDIKQEMDDYINRHEVFDYNEVCTFCGDKYVDCGGDHGDEMRDIQRQALRRHW